MALQDLSIADTLHTAYSRGLPALKTAQVVRKCLEKQYSTESEGRDALAGALLDRLLAPQPPALLYAYLSRLVSSDIALGNTLTQLLLPKLSASPELCASDTLVPLANALLETPWATNTTLPPLPGLLTPAAPAIGTSESAIAVQDAVSTLSLTLPLLRLCAGLPSSAQGATVASAASAPLPVIALTARILAAVPAYPSPPLEVGIEVSVMMPSLPQVVADPLRAALSGMMADLQNADDGTGGDVNMGMGMGMNVDGVANGFTFFSDPTMNGSTTFAGSGAAPSTGADPSSSSDIPTLPSPFTGPAPIPMPHAISFLLAYAQRESRYARVVEQGLWSSHVDIIRVGRAFRVDSASFLLNLVEGAIVAVLDRYQKLDMQFEEALIFWLEHLPDMLKWWKANGTEEWSYPSNVVDCIKTAMETCRSGLQNAWAALQKEYQQRVSVAESHDENSSHAPVEEAPIASYAETFLRKLVQVGVLKAAEARDIWPEAKIVPLEIFAPASMLDDLAESSEASLPVKELMILTGPGSQRSFATSVLGSIRSHPQTPLPEKLLPKLSSSPALLAALTTIIPPRTLLEILVDRLLDSPIDEGARQDDPQGVLTRWGEGVVLVEATVHAFGLELPLILKSSRRSRGMSHLSREHRACLSGWVMALFGSEGIDDQIILQTSPQDLCWLSTVIIQQAIFAMASGQLDLESLHSGLSYFSQPLLSWCLGGIVSWLSAEIVRNGSIAPLHMEVLQSLILEDGFPESLLRVSAAEIMSFMEPTKGLGEVMEKANFDVNAVKAKLQSVGANTLPSELPINSHHPLNVFRSNLQVMRHLEVSPPTWPPSFLADCTNAVARSSPGSATSIMLTDILRPSMEYDQTNGDPLAVFIYILLSLPLDGREPHIKVALDAALTIMLARQMTTQDCTVVASTIKGIMVLFAQLRDGEVKGVLEGLMDKLDLLVKKGHRGGSRGQQDGPDGQARKRSKNGQVRNTSDELVAANAMAVRRMLAADEEMSGRWGKL